jgi:hypothetical protein
MPCHGSHRGSSGILYSVHCRWCACPAHSQLLERRVIVSLEPRSHIISFLGRVSGLGCKPLLTPRHLKVFRSHGLSAGNHGNVLLSMSSASRFRSPDSQTRVKGEQHARMFQPTRNAPEALWSPSPGPVHVLLELCLGKLFFRPTRLLDHRIVNRTCHTPEMETSNTWSRTHDASELTPK